MALSRWTLVPLLVVITVVVPACTSGSSASRATPAAHTAAPATLPAAHTSGGITGATGGVSPLVGTSASASPDFPDPYPAYETAHGTSAPDGHYVFGTRQMMLSCPGPIRPGCYRPAPIHVTIAAGLTARLHMAGTVIATTFNHNPFRDGSGHWAMAVSATVRPVQHPSGSSSQHWSVVLHAHPVGTTSPVPTRWQVDSVLVGSLAHDARADYDGKYFEDDDILYLIYSRRLDDYPARDGVVAQRMLSATVAARTAPVTLLAPRPDDGFASERFEIDKPADRFELIETGNLTRIGDEYVMAYSTGAFDENDYKTGVAWSTSFLPSRGTTYHKLVVSDPHDVWHNPSHQDVRYLLQSQRVDWPADSAASVDAPGVASIVVGADGHLYLIFAGYPATGRPAPSRFDPSTRKAFMAPLSGSSAQNLRIMTLG